MKLDEKTGHFWSLYFTVMKNPLMLEKKCHPSNTFWLYQLRVRTLPIKCYSHLKSENFKWNTLYDSYLRRTLNRTPTPITFLFCWIMNIGTQICTHRNFKSENAFTSLLMGKTTNKGKCCFWNANEKFLIEFVGWRQGNCIQILSMSNARLKKKYERQTHNK